jgi:hypothetical protein
MMPSIWKSKTRWIGGFFLAATLSFAQAEVPAIPGTINYVEGQVTLAGKALTTKSAGSVELEPNQILSTDHGKAEILLTPGVFLRVGDSSAVRMISAELTNTQVELLQGEALVEAEGLLPGNHISILDHASNTVLEKNGLYDFKSAPAQVQVYDGKASVSMDDQNVTLKKGKETLLAGKLHVQKFDRKAEDPLYAWSSLRSQYAAQASIGQAQNIYVDGGWGGPGWYWNPWWDMYSFIPGDFLYSPFGWGFYPPGLAFYAPFYGGYGFYGGYRGYGHGFYGHGPGHVASGQVGHGFAPSHGTAGSFAGHPGFAHGFGGGGFHGGGMSGGFHGGGFGGGGFHGGGGGRR